MGKKKGKKQGHDPDWARAKTLCRLNADDVRKAKELGLSPRTLVKNIPASSQRWKAPVKVWIRELHAKRFGERPPAVPAPRDASRGDEAAEPREPGEPGGRWAARPESEDDDASEPSAFASEPDDDDDEDEDEDLWDDDDPTEADVREEDELMLRRQRAFRRAAEFAAEAFAGLEEVERVVLFGSVAGPLAREVPRFRAFRRNRIEILHECQDVDLAVYVRSTARLNLMRRTLARALNACLAAEKIGVAHHQVDVHVIDAATGCYLGQLCRFRDCPAEKPPCRVPGCGATPHLQRFERFPFVAENVTAGPFHTLFERAQHARTSS